MHSISSTRSSTIPTPTSNSTSSNTCYNLLKQSAPALYMSRSHSFSAWHREGEYDWLCDAHDREMLRWVQKFNPYDLSSKSPQPPNWTELRPYYTELIQKYLPAELAF